MSNIEAYLLGLITALLLIIPFWMLSMKFTTVSNAFLTVFCKQAVTYPSV